MNETWVTASSYGGSNLIRDTFGSISSPALGLSKEGVVLCAESSIDPNNVFPQNICLPAKNFRDQSRLDAKTKICLIFGANLFSLRSEIVDSLRRMSGLIG